MAEMDLSTAQEKLEPALEANAMYQMEIEELKDTKAHLEQEMKGAPACVCVCVCVCAACSPYVKPFVNRNTAWLAELTRCSFGIAVHTCTAELESEVDVLKQRAPGSLSKSTHIPTEGMKRKDAVSLMLDLMKRLTVCFFRRSMVALIHVRPLHLWGRLVLTTEQWALHKALLYFTSDA